MPSTIRRCAPRSRVAATRHIPRTRVTEYSAAGVDVPLDRPKPCGRRIALTVSRTRATCEPAECQGCMAP